jgi:TPR repeat protein
MAGAPGEAVSLLNESAKAGIWKSSMILGVLARDGKGVPHDPESAYYHFRVAALQGGDEAQKLLDYDLRRLAAELSAETSASLDTQAQAWYGQHHAVLEFVSIEKESRARFPDYALAMPQEGSHVAQMLPAMPE